jgi:hypothetical protein
VSTEPPGWSLGSSCASHFTASVPHSVAREPGGGLRRDLHFSPNVD